jgi:hypothetical protein
VRKHRLALDQPGVPERGLFGDAAPIDQRHGASALLQVQGDTNADHAGSQDSNIHSHA